jgi:hypothetical protein
MACSDEALHVLCQPVRPNVLVTTPTARVKMLPSWLLSILWLQSRHWQHEYMFFGSSALRLNRMPVTGMR